MQLSRIAAIIVTYNPNISLLSKLILSLSPQVKSIYVVDNGITEFVNCSLVDNLHFISLGSNQGIATAQNIGIKRALSDGCNDVILFDQDSIPQKTMISELIKTREIAENAGFDVAAVGPVHIDQDTNVGNTFIVADRRIKKIKPERYIKSQTRFSSCSFLIASGCLISKESIESIGLMEEKLFIDCVDIEWGFRAKKKGWHCIAAFDAEMFHKIGDEPLQLLGRTLTTHSPIRHYYFYRNFYSLLKRSYIPLSWKIHTLIKSAIQALVFCTFLEPRWENMKSIAKGAYHGIKGYGGKYEG